MAKKIFIGGAWPYANYFMHVGHLAALLPGDVIARYYRQHGDTVLYVSGTDSHGTPITERSRKEGIEPSVIAHRYHEQDVKDFSDLGFSYDNYGATFMDWHKSGVQDIFKKIYANGYLYGKEFDQVYCETCGKFLSDREIGGKCPVCGKEAKGDQCDFCLSTFNPRELHDKYCLVCGNETSTRPNHELVFALSKFQNEIEEFFKSNSATWRANAINETDKYLKQGLPDRDATRSLSWGINVPFEGYDDKCIYVWFEAVLGYLTSGQYAAEKQNIDFKEFITDSDNLISYYVHGKDNIPFHTVIYPALLLALNEGIQLPKRIISSEYINMGSEKMSKSTGKLVTIRELIDEFDPDTIRFYFIANNPERRDVAFNHDDLIAQHNKFLVGGFGNFVNRNLSFIQKKFKGIVPSGSVDLEIVELTKKLYDVIDEKIANGELRSAVEDMVSYIQEANRYYDLQKPWIQVKEENQTDFNNTTATCLYMMANMSNLFSPVIPFGCAKLRNMLQIETNPSWEEIFPKNDLVLETVEILYERI